MDQLKGELGVSWSQAAALTKDLWSAEPRPESVRPQPTNPDVFSWGLDTVGKDKVREPDGGKDVTR